MDYDKVLVIANSQYPDSLEVANYYIQKRGLNPDHVMNLDFGAVATMLNSLPFREGAITDIADYCDTHDIEGIVLSTHCPKRYEHWPSGVDYDDKVCSFSAIIGQCRKYSHAASASADLQWNIYIGWVGKIGSDGSMGSAYIGIPRSYNGNLKNLIKTDDSKVSIPCGRLGFFSDPAATTVTLVDGTIQSVGDHAKRCIDDAVWFEENGTPANEPMLFGIVDRLATAWMTGVTMELAYDQLKDKVGTKHIYHTNQGGSSSYSSAHKIPRLSTATLDATESVDFLSGASDFTLDLWGWLGLGQVNYNVTNGPNGIDKTAFKRGGWMYESTSSPVSHRSVLNGACCAAGTVTEPQSAGTSCLYAIAQILKHGGSMIEAVWYGITDQTTTISWHIKHQEVIGDPLYRPFRFTPVKSSTNSLTENTL